MSDFDAWIDWDAAARAQRAEADSRAAAESQAAIAPYVANQRLGRIEGLPTNPFDPASAKLSYNQGAYSYNGHYGSPVWVDGNIVGYDFVQHDIAPGVMSVIRTDANGNISEQFQGPEGESLTIGDVLKAVAYIGAATSGLGGIFGGLGTAGAGIGAGLTAEQALAMEALGGAEVAGGLTATEAAAAGLGGGFGNTAAMLGSAAAGSEMTAEQVAAMEGLGGSDVAGGLTSTEASAAELGGGFTGTDGLLSGQPTSTSPSTTSSAANKAANSGLTGSQVNTALNIAKIALPLAGLGVAGASFMPNEPSGFGIVPIPEDWKSPVNNQIGQNAALPPIDFGNRDLLKGTQWDNSQAINQLMGRPVSPSGMTYDQLVNTLQGRSNSAPSLNDIISGIQSQYGQKTSSTVG